ncbi:hypothetical protein [Clostridium sp. ZBS2]|uniref:hypothetical protein n=1 Tax=Clostridium sp. ZBS2 TaxID=2949976 RepID=UPI002079F1ED|nr:hypothetical protein [Clostridium sp. ZBS2]
MCNHIGSYILNDVLKAVNESGIFKEIGKERTQELTLRIFEVGRNYDCNDTEILDGIAQECGVCSFCPSASDDINAEGICTKCRQDK